MKREIDAALQDENTDFQTLDSAGDQQEALSESAAVTRSVNQRTSKELNKGNHPVWLLTSKRS